MAMHNQRLQRIPQPFNLRSIGFDLGHQQREGVVQGDDGGGVVVTVVIAAKNKSVPVRCCDLRAVCADNLKAGV